MRIGLLSDTHIRDGEEKLPAEVGQAFRGVDLILHAGDIYIPSVLDELERIAPVLAARGDDDDGEVLEDKRVKQKHILQLQGQTLWVVHRLPSSYISLSLQAQPSGRQGSDGIADIVVFGHEHRTFVQRHGHALFINPGSPTFLEYHPGLGTVGILETDSGEPQVTILEL